MAVVLVTVSDLDIVASPDVVAVIFVDLAAVVLVDVDVDVLPDVDGVVIFDVADVAIVEVDPDVFVDLAVFGIPDTTAAVFID